MSRPTFVSLFSGGGGADIGARDAGYELACGYELDPAIAEVANANLGQHVRVGNILDVDPHDCPKPDLLHASPPCPNFSVAKAGRQESALDIALADKVVEFIDVLQPHAFTLENVGQYEKSQSFKRIVAALNRSGYWLHWDVLNAANFGVPQTRRRLILRAVRGGLVPYLPAPLPWVGWYAAIEDLIPTLPESKFADWQLARLPAQTNNVLVGQQYDKPADDPNRAPQIAAVGEPAMTVTASLNAKGKMPHAFIINEREMHAYRDRNDVTLHEGDAPIFTLNATSNPNRYKAFLVSSNTSKGDVDQCVVYDENQPAFAVAGSSKWSRAFIISNAKTEWGDGVRSDTEPMLAVTGESKGRVRAFLMAKTADKYGDGLRMAGEPAQTIGANEHGSRAFIVDGKPANYAGELQIVDADDPVVTVTSSQTRHPFRAWLSQGRVVAMTPRALARFQSIPDWYELPAKAGLACKIVGNAVPPLMYRAVAEGLVP